MRDPGTEPLPMISGDVMELHYLIYAEREAHAAEVARLRGEPSAAHESFEEIHCGNAQCESKYGGCDQSCKREAYRASQRIEAALAEQPTAAAQAVENALKAAHDVLEDYDSSEEGRIGKRSAWVLRTALAAYEEATRD